jgi:glucose uptake protein GlcU
MTGSTYVVVGMLVSVLVTSVSAIGCGEKLVPGGSCSDIQCTRNYSNYCVAGWLKGSNCTETSDCYIGLECTNKICEKKPHGTKNPGIGYAAAFVAIVCFGSSFVPIKRFKKYAGDGVFAQFCMCFGRFALGLIILMTRDNKQFYPMAALSGMFWSAGNCISVPIIQCIGMGLGIAIWGTTNMLLGWASGEFGWWGVNKEDPKRPWLNYLSVVFSAFSILLFLFVNPMGRKKNPAPAEDLYPSPIGEKPFPEEEEGTESERVPINPSTEEGPKPLPTIADIIGRTPARIIGVSLALVAGALFGLCMDPAQHMMDNYEHLTATTDTKYTPYGFDYVFSFNVGAIAFSFLYLSSHLILNAFGVFPTRRYFDEVKHAKIILPAFANGIIGSCGSCAWFLANQNLGLIVSFPIIAAGPGVVSALWGTLVFHEIRGMRNYILLVCAFLGVISSSLCSAYASIE